MTLATAPIRFDLPTDTHQASDVVAPRKCSLFGVGVSITDYAGVVRYLTQLAKRNIGATVSFAPANIIVEAASTEDFRNKLNDFDLVCPDGQPVRWCMNHFHKADLADRVYGPATTLLLCEAAERENISIYLYGASPKTLEQLQAELNRRFPKLVIAGVESPPFRPLTAEEHVETAERINESGAGLVFLGIGSIKQENFAWKHRNDIHAVQLCVGAAFDFIAGNKSKAPAWMQRNGLEWLFRLACEPRRLFRRYAVTNTMFVYYVFREQLRRMVGLSH